MLCREWWKAEQKCQGVQSSGAPLCEEDSSWQLPTRHRKYNKSEGGNWKGVLWGPAVTFDIAEDFNDVVWAMYGPDIARLVRERQELLQDEGSDADTGVLDRKVKALTSEIGRMGYERYLEVVTENENDEHEDDR